MKNLPSHAQYFHFRRFFLFSFLAVFCLTLALLLRRHERENNAKNSKSVPSAKRTGIIQSIWYQRRQQQPLQQSQKKDGGGLLLRRGRKISVEEIYILQSYYFMYYKKNIIIQGIPNKWIRYECSACLNFRMRKFSLASDSNEKSFSLAVGMRSWYCGGIHIRRRHHYTQHTSNFPGCKNLDTRLNHNHLITGMGSTFVSENVYRQTIPFGLALWVWVCSYSLPLPGAYHADELVNIWRARFLSLPFSRFRPTSGQFY